MRACHDLRGTPAGPIEQADHSHRPRHRHPPQPGHDGTLTYPRKLEIAVREPRAMLHELGLGLPDKVAVRVHDSTSDMRYLVLPMRPAGTEDLSESQFAALVTRDSMIGTTVLRAPS